MSRIWGEATVPTPVGSLRVEAGPAGLGPLRWMTPQDDPAPACSHLMLDRAVAALRAYFLDPRQPRPALPLAPLQATAFQRRVWRGMCAIPPGEVRTYGELAARVGGAPRAVGMAAAANPWPVLVPCHRVVARNGLGGYGGQIQGRGPSIKAWLLRHEGADWACGSGEPAAEGRQRWQLK